MNQKYEVTGGTLTEVGGHMPEEFHKLHFANNLIRTVSIECAQCGERDEVDDSVLMRDIAGDPPLEEMALKKFYSTGWRYCALPDYQVEGIFCMGCIRDDGGVENNTLQQPYAKEAIDEP